MLKKSFFTVIFLVFTFASYAETIYLAPIPRPTQYQNIDQYERALTIWKNVQAKVMARSNIVQMPPMPKPTQYRNQERYDEALAIWRNLGNTPRSNAFAYNGNIVIRLNRMPKPTQYRKVERYTEALKIWQESSQNMVLRNPKVQLPYMPLPTQYRSLEQYEEALRAWESIVK